MASIDFSARSAALILIDLQNAIAARQMAPHDFKTLVANTNRLTSAFREKGGTVVFVRVDIADMLHLPVDEPVRDPHAPPPPPKASRLVADVDRRPSDLVVTKRSWGAFYGTDLEQQLRRRGIKTIAVGGVATNFGVESTAREAFDRGYEVIFIEDAMSSVAAEAHQFATSVVFPRMGRVRTTQDVISALAQ